MRLEWVLCSATKGASFQPVVYMFTAWSAVVGIAAIFDALGWFLVQLGLRLASCFAVLVGLGLATMVPGSISLPGNGLVRASQTDEAQWYSKVFYERYFLRDLQNAKVSKRLDNVNNRAANRSLV